MILRLAFAASLLALSNELVQPAPPRSTLLAAQQSCLKVAVQSGQDKISPIGVRRVCGVDAVQPSINPDSVALPGPTGVVGQPEINDELVACTEQDGTVVPGCWLK